jgi:hypothetical protein
VAGREWEGVLAIEGVPTGDGRMIERNALTWETGPWPLHFDLDGNSHFTGVVIGEVREVWRSGNQILGRGTLHTDSAVPEVRDFATRVAELSENPAGSLAGLSVMFDSEDVEVRISSELFKAYVDPWDEDAYEAEQAAKKVQAETKDRVTIASWSAGDELWVFTAGRLREVSVAPVQAIVGSELHMSKKAVAAATWARGAGIVSRPVSAVAAAAFDAAFSDPKFGADSDKDPRLVFQKRRRSEETDGFGAPFTVEDDGRVWGHFALHGRCHSAYSSCLVPPDSGGDFSEFLTGEAQRGVRTGPIILGTTHSVNPDGTVKDYDHLANTGEAVADVTVGRDSHGFWVSGRVRPGITPAQLASLKGSALSGEWLPYGSQLKLRGILAVNSPGYLIERRGRESYALAASAAGGPVLFTVSPACCGGDDPTLQRVKLLEDALARSLARGVV